MLNGYMDQVDLKPTDMRLLYGLVSKLPTCDVQEDVMEMRHRVRKEKFAEAQIVKAEQHKSVQI